MHRRQFMAGAVATAVCGIAISGIVPGEAAARSGVHVYLVKGTLGLSPGLDELGEKLRRRGINATVHDLGEASALAVQAVQKYKSGRERTIVLIGHSSGGSAILTMAGDLDHAGVPIALAIPLDPPWAVPVPANVRRVDQSLSVGRSGRRHSARSEVPRLAPERGPQERRHDGALCDFVVAKNPQAIDRIRAGSDRRAGDTRAAEGSARNPPAAERSESAALIR